MAKATTIQAKIDEDTEVRAQSILNALHISMPEAISMYLRQIIFHGGIPFAVKIPNELTAKVLADAQAGKGVQGHSI